MVDSVIEDRSVPTRLDDLELLSAKDRISRVFKYLRALHAQRTPAVCEIEKHPWTLYLDELPSHPAIVLKRPTALLSSLVGEATAFACSVTRPALTDCPQPPAVIRDWLSGEHQAGGAAVHVIKTRHFEGPIGQPYAEQFDSCPERVASLASWLEDRKRWDDAERPSQQVAAIFSRLFALHARMQRDAEKYQLWLADGHLRWRSDDQVVNHPLILQRVELQFDANVPKFSIVESPEPPELHAATLRQVNLDGGCINSLGQSQAESLHHPLGEDGTNSFLKHLVHTFWEDGSFELDATIQNAPTEKPLVTRRPVLFLGERTQGFDAAMARLESYLRSAAHLPESLTRLVGIEAPASAADCAMPLEPRDGLSLAPDVMLTKPANAEQIRVIRKLTQSGSVVVQGPPGTGKTHTIANLIGHLLAAGKTVLVTSHTSKALRVLREKVHSALQPLCVSVLDSDEQSRRELEHSVSGIVAYLSRTDRAKLNADLAAMEARRIGLIDRHNRLAQDLLLAKRAEYDVLVCGGDTVTPSNAARFLAANQVHGWIPGPVVEGAVLPLSQEEILDLYASNADLSALADRCLAQVLPDPSKLPSEAAFAEVAAELSQLPDSASPAAPSEQERGGDRELFLSLSQISRNIQEQLSRGEPWFLAALLAGIEGGPPRDLWQALVDLFKLRREQIIGCRELLMTYGPTFSGDHEPKDAALVAREIVRHLRVNSKVGTLWKMLKPAWRRLIATHRVNGGEPSTADHFEAIAALHDTKLWRLEIANRWIRQLEPLHAPTLDTVGERVEDFVLPFAQRIQRALRWSEDVWEPFIARVLASGLDWADIQLQSSDAVLGSTEIDRIQFSVARLCQLSKDRASALRRQELVKARHEWTSYLQGFFGNSEPEHPVFALQSALAAGDPELYRSARRRLVDVTSLEARMQRRTELIRRLEKVAPGWACAIRGREEPHHEGRPPRPEVAAAWMFRQWSEQLARCQRINLDDLQRELMSARSELYSVSAEYVELSAWCAQLERTGLRQQQALVGWLDLQRKIGKGKGKRAPRLQAEARKLLAECRDAVPVWIMPTSRVYESFDPTRARFDVLILDEASQCDVTNIALFAMADEAVVVGDHEQVTPLAVGQDIGSMQSLIDEFLAGVPNAVQYDPKTSVYHLARQCFGETIRLVEHFRSVPDIINFSNALSYSGEICPLREAASARVGPPMIAHRVFQGVAYNKVNATEADEVASLILAASDHQAYTGLTFGVISLVGTDQALRIEEHLRRHMPEERYAERRIVCGNAAQFQGDERDVMFLSMVDANGTLGPLKMRQTDEWRKSFNVAVSRARDQVWVVHSLSPETDLKDGDLRKRLIRHAENPLQTAEQILNFESRSASDFERLIAQGLTKAGFRVDLQVAVGAFRIDIVVSDLAGRRLAVECDGDRWHPPEKHGEDLARQFVLERLGWRFVRIRGSEFFADQKSALSRLVARIIAFGVEPDLSREKGARARPADEEVKRSVVAAAGVWRRRLVEVGYS